MTSSPIELADPHVRASRFTRLAAEHVHEIEIQRSVFRTVLAPVRTEDDARAVIEEQRRAFHDARHHCSAFVLGPDQDTQRSSDDGEPAGTAGIPMLTALAQRETSDERRDLTDIVAVVTRWFGGILLGAGGLVRAYSDSVSQALDGARFETWHRQRELLVTVDMAQAGRAEHVMRGLGYTLLDTTYSATGCCITIAVTDSEDGIGGARAALLTAFAGEVDIAEGRAVWAQ
ncbi:YigZ family protein [Pseudoglutamicibacter cumminsii]|uniref:IMPACT family protein n=1 Tax=Pseudoglutamicibacter cumminsii TaxID=156979 RepID=UPI002555FB50|nr:YigZ family protein [Pseudoglutamicibacter cumminsii]MDK7082902.1 YigZ family protein [Pseudoglutamicibacter cumminsii]